MNYVITTGRTVDEAVNDALTKLKLQKNEVTIEVLQEPSKGFLGFGQKEAAVKVTKKEDTEDILKEIFSLDLESEKSNDIKEENKDLTRNETAREKLERFEKAEIERSKGLTLSDEFKSDDDFYDEDEEESSIEEENVEENVVENSSEEKVSDENLNVIDDEEFDFETFKTLSSEFLSKILSPLEIEYKTEITMEDNVLNVNILGDENSLGIVIGKRGTTLDSIQYILSLIINKHSKRFVRVIVDSSGYRMKRRETLTDLAQKLARRAIKTNKSVHLEPMASHERKIIHEALKDYPGVFTHSEGTEPNRHVVIQIEQEY